jgi:hypothetical protein
VGPAEKLMMLKPQKVREYITSRFEDNLIFVLVSRRRGPRALMGFEETADRVVDSRIADKAAVARVDKTLQLFQLRHPLSRPDQPDFFRALFGIKL